MQKAVMSFSAFMCFISLGISQSVVLEPYGVSPRDVAADTVGDPDYLGIFDRAYNGLLNVGVETKMYLQGSFVDSNLTNAAWIVLESPAGSSATFGPPADVDDATQIVAFIPDLAGTYVIEFAVGTFSDTLIIHAGTYVGIEDGNCVQCHDNAAWDYITSNWASTGHYEHFENGMTGVLSYYASYCINCHVTGYDSYADNDGFDDRTQYVPIYETDTTFVFPSASDLFDYYGSPDSTRYPGVWDSLLVFFPNSMKLARIQCESCHGPGDDHFGVISDSKMVKTLSTDNCAICHDSGTHHVFPEQWDISGHASVPGYPSGSRTTCRGCHNGAQFIQYVSGEEITVQPPVDITCATCHDPHDATNTHQIRTVEAVLSNNEVVAAGGTGKLCMNCHQNRRDADSYTDAPHNHYGPHYMPQADMLIGTNAVTFGQNLPSSPHLYANENTCVDCHMYQELDEDGDPILVDENGNVVMVGSHTFKVVGPDMTDNVAVCTGCHGDVGESFDVKKYYFNGNADHDGDGIEEGLQEEVHGLLEELAVMLPHPDTTDAYDPHDDVDDTWTRTELKAAFNYEMVYYDRSYGIHNPAFTVALLKVSLQALMNNAVDGEIVAIDDVPNDQGKQVKIIWDKFVDDGVAIDPIASYTIKRYDEYDDTWTGVGEHTADGSDRYAMVVPTLFDSTDAGLYLTTFKVVAISLGGIAHESLSASGYSIDNLIPQAPANMMVSVFDQTIEIAWEAPDDPDINYYQVYRSTEPNFPADETTGIGTTVELAYVDQNISVDTYYYKVAAVDFSGNRGELSVEVAGEILSVKDNLHPIEYAISQNYPNPFNPVTLINFSLPEKGLVTLKVYNSLGQIVTTLVNRKMEPGIHSISFNGDNLPSGIYFYTISANDYIQTRKMILLK